MLSDDVQHKQEVTGGMVEKVRPYIRMLLMLHKLSVSWRWEEEEKPLKIPLNITQQTFKSLEVMTLPVMVKVTRGFVCLPALNMPPAGTSSWRAYGTFEGTVVKRFVKNSSWIKPGARWLMFKHHTTTVFVQWEEAGWATHNLIHTATRGSTHICRSDFFWMFMCDLEAQYMFVNVYTFTNVPRIVPKVFLVIQ